MMINLRYQFADGHTEVIEVTEEVAAVFEELQKYEKKVERKETRRHISLELLKEKGYKFPDFNGFIINAIDKRERKYVNGKRKNSTRQNLPKEMTARTFAYFPTGRSVFQV